MNDTARLLVLTWLSCQLASLLMIRIGVHYASHRYLVRLGAIAHRQKMQALDHIWPLTKLRAAAGNGQVGRCTLILAALIILKSLACLVFGIAMIFWLPVASLLVPAIVARHDPDDPGLMAWVRRVAMLQVSSHTLAAALGATVAWQVLHSDATAALVIVEHATLFALVAAASLGFAIAAGRIEALGVMQRGL